MRRDRFSPAAADLAGESGTAMVPRFVRAALDRYLLLPLGVLLALLWANTGPETYFTFSHAIAFLVNDVLMALFFGLLAQEIVEEVMPGGALHTWRRWAMPIIAAVGGTIVAPLVYLLYVGVSNETVLNGAWPVACAVDVVAAYYVLAAIRPRRGILPFAVLMAIAADVLALLLVAPVRQSLTMHPSGAVLIVLAVGLAAVMRKGGVKAFWPYLAVCGTISWFGFYVNGLQPALALVPIVAFLPHEPRALDSFPDTPDNDDDDRTRHLEHEWNEVVQAVLFLFGLVNGGIMLNGYGTGTWALLTAALVGRPVGMLLAMLIANIAGLQLPKQVSWREVVVATLATSSGFSLGLFFAVSLVPIGPVLNEVKAGVELTLAGVALAFAAAWALKVGAFHHHRVHG